MKNTKSVLGFMLIMLLELSTGLMAQTYSGGSGTEGAPYQIANKADLKYLSENSGEWSKHFIQTADITFDDADFQSGGDFYNSGYGFSPIGDNSTFFHGSYDGDGHTIDNLYINPSKANIGGLFGFAYGTTINNLGVTNVNITGQSYVGGLVGYIRDNSEVSNSYSTGSVTGSGDYVGGLVGYNYGNSTVSNSYSTGSVTGDDFVGGLVGWNYWASTVENSYSTGSVTGSGDYVGGLVGSNTYNSTVSNIYSTGSVSGTSSVGGLVGYNNNSTVSNSFWDTETSGQSSSDGGTGKTTAQMKTLATFTAAGWNIIESYNTSYTWNMESGINSGYPYLSWAKAVDSSLPVELSSWIATSKAGQVLLTWITDSEIENLGFIIERKNARGNWNEIASFSNHESLHGQGSTTLVTEYQYRDKDVQVGQSYTYRLSDVDYHGKVTKHAELSVTVKVDDNTMLADQFILHSAFPNPFNPSVTVRYELPKVSDVSITIYDMFGRNIWNLN
ncbi:MAG: GLUG motif-containing protein, partial [Candidatus Marinimicrobia bacterium]|nr:GLUG motif-containing protein [Candidatus Neomarinimicrobiota bacterium]